LSHEPTTIAEEEERNAALEQASDRRGGDVNVTVQGDVRGVAEACRAWRLVFALDDQPLPIQLEHGALRLNVHGEFVVTGREKASHGPLDTPGQAPRIIFDLD
jgi:hypothetical protein